MVVFVDIEDFPIILASLDDTNRLSTLDFIKG
jgi:hypothetical protein